MVERHQTKTTIVTSNREPAEWLTMTADTLLAQSAIDRLTAATPWSSKDRHTANAPDPASLTQTTPTSILNNAPRWSHPPGNQVVPSPWQATASSNVAASVRGDNARVEGISSSNPPAR